MRNISFYRYSQNYLYFQNFVFPRCSEINFPFTCTDFIVVIGHTLRKCFVKLSCLSLSEDEVFVAGYQVKQIVQRRSKCV